MIRSRTKAHVLRGMGGLIAAMAVLPWLAGTSAQAASSALSDCTTIPSGVSPTATCAPLLGPNGKTVFGETWAWRTGGNNLKVDTFPLSAPGAGTPVTLCVTSSGPYPIKHQCNAGDSDNVFAGSATSITVALDKVGIGASDPVYYSLSVLQASTTANSNGNGGAAPSRSPSPSPSNTSATPSATRTSQAPSASVSATKTHRTDGATPSTSVLAVKLAHTGPDGTGGVLVLSVGLLALGGILVAAGQTSRPSRRH
jgi:hypothetical protein